MSDLEAVKRERDEARALADSYANGEVITKGIARPSMSSALARMRRETKPAPPPGQRSRAFRRARSSPCDD